jgi:hypothetical protein
MNENNSNKRSIKDNETEQKKEGHTERYHLENESKCENNGGNDDDGRITLDGTTFDDPPKAATHYDEDEDDGIDLYADVM